MMTAISYTAEEGGWTLKRVALVSGASILGITLAQHRRVVLGCALGIVGGRLIIGILMGYDFFPLFAVAAAALVSSWFLLKGVS